MAKPTACTYHSNSRTLDLKLTAPAFREFVSRVEENFIEPYTPTLVFSNYDRIGVFLA